MRRVGILAAALVWATGCGDDERLPASDAPAAGADGAGRDGAAIDGASGADAASADGGGGVVVSRLGTPVFDLVDWQIFSAPLGSPSDRTAGIATVEAIWTTHAWDATYGVIAPDLVHAPPYDGEITSGLAGADIVPTDRFTVTDWTAPKGIFFAGTIVPGAGAPTGKSPDFASGAIVPTTIFPFDVEGELFNKGGLVVDTSFATTPIPTVNQVAPSGSPDGYSHIPMAWGENTAAIAGTPGFYHLEVTIVDKDGNGWLVDLPFRVD